jgi:hypothetical protein
MALACDYFLWKFSIEYVALKAWAWGTYKCLLLAPSDIYFIGGFGTVAWVDVNEYETLQPDKIAVDGGEQNLKVNFFEFLQTTQRKNVERKKEGDEWFAVYFLPYIDVDCIFSHSHSIY